MNNFPPLPEGGPLSPQINNKHFTPEQQSHIVEALGAFIDLLNTIAPQLAPHFLSGGFVEIKTMSGAKLSFGFGPRAGGLILPGGIRPRPDLGRPK